MIPVLTADQARSLDQAAIMAGTDSFGLMRRAGDRLAHHLFLRDPDLAGKRVQVVVGPGNNGGDGWVAASILRSLGCEVAVFGASPKSVDAVRARTMCPNDISAVVENPHVVLDAVLGTGATGPVRPELSDAFALLGQSDPRRRIAVDLPSGLDATTGEAVDGCPRAELTITFGTWKRGQLLRRDLVGELVCLDIGLPDPAPGVPLAADAAWVGRSVPPIAPLDTKSERRRLILVGGMRGMAGSTILAARGAFRSGVGMVRCYVHPESISALNAAVPQATAVPWPDSPAEIADELRWGHTVVIGPGFGLADGRERIGAWLAGTRGPVVLDADALSAFAGAPDELGRLCAGRSTVITPHVAEAARLLGIGLEEVRSDPFGAARRLAGATGVTVLLKGVPSLVARGDELLVVPRGAALLGTGGSGDLLSGMVGTLLAQSGDPMVAAGTGAWVHGRAGEIASVGGQVRGLTLDEVIGSLAQAWRLEADVAPEFERGRLPRVGHRA